MTRANGAPPPDDEVQADLAAGRLEAAVLKLGQLAAEELLRSDTAPAPVVRRGTPAEGPSPLARPEHGTAAVSVPPENGADRLWESAVHRAREEAGATPPSTEPDELVAAVVAEETAFSRITIPLAALLLLALTAAVVISGMNTFNRAVAWQDQENLVDSAALASAPTAEPTRPAATRTPAPRPSPVLAPSAPPPASAVDTAPEADDAEEPCLDGKGNPLPPTSWLCRGRAVRASGSPGGAGGPVEREGAPVAPAYQVVNTLRLGMPSRVRYEVSVVVPPDLGRDGLVTVLAEAARKTLRERPDARAVGIFAHSSQGMVGKGWDRGRALISMDGQGWTGDRTFAPVARDQKDQGRIYLTLGTTLAPGEQMEVDR